MKQFKALYRGQCGKEYELDLLAESLSAATASATELIPQESTLIRVYYNPQWE